MDGLPQHSKNVASVTSRVDAVVIHKIKTTE